MGKELKTPLDSKGRGMGHSRSTLDHQTRSCSTFGKGRVVHHWTGSPIQSAYVC
jgi:hypothetical protein